MRQIFLAAGIMMIATTATFAHANLERNTDKHARRELRKEHRMERRAERRSEVSDLTKSEFSRDFPDAKNVRFVKTKNFDEASFWDGKKKMKAYYDDKSQLVGTTQKKTLADLPGKALEKIQEKYADYKVNGVIMFNDNEDNDMDMILYGTSFDDADNYFVELAKGSKTIVVKVDLMGEVSFFKEIK